MVCHVMHQFLPQTTTSSSDNGTTMVGQKRHVEEDTSQKKRPKSLQECTVDALDQEERELLLNFRAHRDLSMHSQVSPSLPQHLYRQQGSDRVAPSRHFSQYGAGAQTVININNAPPSWDEERYY